MGVTEDYYSTLQKEAEFWAVRLDIQARTTNAAAQSAKNRGDTSLYVLLDHRAKGARRRADTHKARAQDYKERVKQAKSESK